MKAFGNTSVYVHVSVLVLFSHKLHLFGVGYLVKNYKGSRWKARLLCCALWLKGGNRKKQKKQKNMDKPVPQNGRNRHGGPC